MLTLNQSNKAVQFQKSMDTNHQNIFARALPHDGTPLDVEAIRQFEDYANAHELFDALAFLHEAVSPTALWRKLSGL